VKEELMFIIYTLTYESFAAIKVCNEPSIYTSVFDRVALNPVPDKVRT
jgi:hypothetical protein